MSSRTYSLRICVAIGVWLLIVGCASLYQPLPRRIEATRLSCWAYPEIVDGNLATTNSLKVKSGNRDSIQYGDWLEGKDKAVAWIQLDTLTPVAYIKVRPVSRIYRLSVDTTTAEFGIDHGKSYLFESVKSHKIAKSEDGAVIHIDIDRPVRILRVSIYANRDLAGATREPLTHEMKAPFEDIVIREIQVYQ